MMYPRRNSPPLAVALLALCGVTTALVSKPGQHWYCCALARERKGQQVAQGSSSCSEGVSPGSKSSRAERQCQNRA